MELNGYSILTAFDGVEGINRFGELKNRRDFVACDFNMPRQDSISTMHSLLTIKPEVKVPFVSGSAEYDNIF